MCGPPGDANTLLRMSIVVVVGMLQGVAAAMSASTALVSHASCPYTTDLKRSEVITWLQKVTPEKMKKDLISCSGEEREGGNDNNKRRRSGATTDGSNNK